MSQNTSTITIAKTDYYIIKVNTSKNRAYLTLFEYWKKRSDFSNYLSDLQTAYKELLPGFTVLVDLIHYDGSSPELHSLHVEAQKLSKKAGLRRIADVLSVNPIVKLFSQSYSKESGSNTMSFNNIEIAEKWLDLY